MHMVCHIEWSSTILSNAKPFYGGLFDWKSEPWGDDFLMFSAPEGGGGTLMKTDKVIAGRSPVVYVSSGW
jgi:predicted enzyme related to lactoylglutathione lyase